MRSPAFQFYPEDFLAGVAEMTNEEVGAYMRLLCLQWSKDGLPDDPARLSRMAGNVGKRALSHVLVKFERDDKGLLRNPRLERERKKQADYRDKQSKNGKLGSASRWGEQEDQPSYGVAIAQPSTKNGTATVSPIATPQPNDNSAVCCLLSADKKEGAEGASPPIPRKTQRMIAARPALTLMRELSGRGFREVEANLLPIANRLDEPGVTMEGVLAMLRREWECRKGDPAGEEWFKPDTIFRRRNFDGFYSAKELPPRSRSGAKPQNAEPAWSRRKAIEAKLHDHPGDPHNPANSRKLDTEEFKAHNKAFLALKHELRMLPTE